MAMMESVRGRGSGRSGGREHGVEGVFTSHHEVQVRLGHMAEAAVKDDGQCNVVERRVVGGGVAGADAARVLAEARVAPVVVGILDRPVAAVPGKELFRARSVGRHRGDGVDGLGGACQRALTFEDPKYRTVKTILENGIDLNPSDEPALDRLTETYTCRGCFCRDTTKLLTH